MLLQIQEPDEEKIGSTYPALGIDLGTTNSVVAVQDEDGSLRILEIEPQGLVPSAVSYGDTIRVGKASLGHSPITSIKRYLGQGLTPDHLPETPIEISSRILKYLKDQAESLEGHPFTEAVITVPAYFDDGARSATKHAANRAGLNVLRLINEPTAAALAYGLDQGAQGTYAIYDLGGGTFDVSILKLHQGVFQVLSTHGDLSLGGDDFDALLADHLSISILEARKIKESGTRDYDFLFQGLVQKTLASVQDALNQGGLKSDDILGVVLVGGSTRLPLVRDSVATFFGKAPLCDHNPDTTVALGAALQAKALTRGSDTLLLDVCPLSLGIETMGDLVEVIIPRNTPIPISKTQTFTTSHPGQVALKLHVVQGEKERVSLNRSLASFELRGIPPMEAGEARIHVTFTLDVDGLLTVSAQEDITGLTQEVVVKPSYGLTLDQMKDLIQ